jgi:hypothetical protein
VPERWSACFPTYCLSSSEAAHVCEMDIIPHLLDLLSSNKGLSDSEDPDFVEMLVSHFVESSIHKEKLDNSHCNASPSAASGPFEQLASYSQPPSVSNPAFQQPVPPAEIILTPAENPQSTASSPPCSTNDLCLLPGPSSAETSPLSSSDEGRGLSRRERQKQRNRAAAKYHKNTPAKRTERQEQRRERSNVRLAVSKVDQVVQIPSKFAFPLAKTSNAGFSGSCSKESNIGLDELREPGPSRTAALQTLRLVEYKCAFCFCPLSLLFTIWLAFLFG